MIKIYRKSLIKSSFMFVYVANFQTEIRTVYSCHVQNQPKVVSVNSIPPTYVVVHPHTHTHMKQTSKSTLDIADVACQTKYNANHQSSPSHTFSFDIQSGVICSTSTSMRIDVTSKTLHSFPSLARSRFRLYKCSFTAKLSVHFE